MKRAFVIFITLALCALLLLCSSCASNEGALDEYKEILDSLSQSEQQSNEAFADKVYVIIPEDCSGELSLKARELANAIIEKTGVSSLVKYDNEDISLGDDDLALLLGATKYIASQEAIKPLRRGDYVCRWDGGELILGGRHDDATVAAIEKFISDVLHGASRANLMSENASFEQKSIYEFSDVTLNGFDLYDYTFVYAGNDNGDEKKYLEALREYIVKRSGYFLKMISEDELDDKVGKIISFKKDTKMRGASIELLDKDLYIKAAGEYELGVVTAKIADELLSGSDGVSDASIDSCTLDCGIVELDLCRAFSVCPDEPDMDFLTEWSYLMQSGEYDVVVFDGVAPWLLEYAQRENIGYELYTKADADGNFCLVLYKEGVLEDVSVEVGDKAIIINMKCTGESDVRRLVCPTVTDKDSVEVLLDTSGGYDVFLLGGEAKLDLLKRGMAKIDSKVCEVYGKEQTLSLVANDIFEFDGEVTVVEGDICHANLFLSFSYKPLACDAFEALKD